MKWHLIGEANLGGGELVNLECDVEAETLIEAVKGIKSKLGYPKHANIKWTSIKLLPKEPK